ncbi:MAG: hypothetical protein EOP02_08080 [Proteobacteria bacterium]|nr:MAG: hypothetical protein EOP02_08080 [Pseudomonadota bacterium]
MTQERIDNIETPDGNTHTSTTIITDRPKSGMSGWFVMFVVLAAVLVALWAFTAMGSSEMVGDAAGQVGTAAQDAASDVAPAAAE